MISFPSPLPADCYLIGPTVTPCVNQARITIAPSPEDVYLTLAQGVPYTVHYITTKC